ncbi:MAG: DUF4214 domain-containing protein [Acidimicrobiales bacterium]
MKPTTDFRHVYGTILRDVAEGNAAAILETAHTDLGFLASPTSDAGPPPTLAAATETNFRRIYDEVVSLYLAYFNRLPDEAGFEHWLRVANSGISLNEISNAFAQSSEFASTYRPLSTRRSSTLSIRTCSGSAPDADGKRYWQGVLESGSSRGAVMIGFSGSPEFRAKTEALRDRFDRRGPIGRLYLAYFTREADADGLHHWISTGLPAAVVSQEFSRSDEFAQRYGSLSNTGFVDLIYQNVLGRSPDVDGGRYWVARLVSGLSRGEVMLAFSDSPEFVSKVAAS